MGLAGMARNKRVAEVILKKRELPTIIIITLIKIVMFQPCYNTFGQPGRGETIQ